MNDSQDSPLRKWRTDAKLNLEEACEKFAEAGFEKPSTAKLSRIERDQDVPIDMIPALKAVTGLTAQQLCPEVAKLFDASEAAQ